MAETQTAGRGRLGRGWQCGNGEPGGALAFSLAVPLAPRDWSGLSLAVGTTAVLSVCGFGYRHFLPFRFFSRFTFHCTWILDG